MVRRDPHLFDLGTRGWEAHTFLCLEEGAKPHPGYLVSRQAKAQPVADPGRGARGARYPLKKKKKKKKKKKREREETRRSNARRAEKRSLRRYRRRSRRTLSRELTENQKVYVKEHIGRGRVDR